MPITYDTSRVQVNDSNGVYLISQLEKYDYILHQPLQYCSWSRDIDLREDITVAHQLSSFSRSKFGLTGGTEASGSGIPWFGDESTAIPSASVDTEKVTLPIRDVVYNLKYSELELQRSKETGQPIDQQKLAAIQSAHQMNIDHMVYMGAPEWDKAYGLTNHADVSVGNSTIKWDTADAKAIQDSILDGMSQTWKASAFRVPPSHILVPPKLFNKLNITVSAAGTMSILEYIKKNNVYTQSMNGAPLNIYPVKWLDAEVRKNKENRIVFYTKDQNYVRYPMTPLQASTLSVSNLIYSLCYYCTLGQVEIVYPDTVSYMDGV
ncbi:MULTISPECIES: major capsid family protein [Commensalibacter]|uniref:major capsid family protein n=1 Tax=Commensalibacter TaxID=1079922 RepID=UPI0012D9BEE1|nr:MULTISPECIES: major capsid family protein [Commensalibacter]MBI0016378.1 DUF2184 domain-containing protein [Commensalibacter sp. B14384M2]MBI0049252.1 DUF2184 domain-containing protein [Commensalibacter sp. B14384M3]MBI0178908.1 DUF2184 domain-containing protein [Commensalibacter sp. W8163]MUH05402.1 DUF2184 domain-containing protein [Commensalibacter melissae]MUH07227.1 DUF2184 domain-containing protein [Commensalibacter melissae]